MSPIRNRIQNYGYAGLAPFFAGAGLVWIVPEEIGRQITYAFIAYAGVILSFLGGIVWGPYIGASVANDKVVSESESEPLVDIGIIASLVAWAVIVLAWWLQSASWLTGLVIVSAFSFYVLRRTERASASQNQSVWFGELRDFLTKAVLASHFSVAIYLVQL